MARQTDTEITGRLGDILFYKRGSEFLLRAVPRQAEASIQSARSFGLASSKAKLLRQLLLPLLPDPRDKDMQNRLCTTMFKFLSVVGNTSGLVPEESPLEGFRFLQGSSLGDCLKFPLNLNKQADGRIQLELPDIRPLDAIAAPAGCSRVELRMLAAVFQPQDSATAAGEPALIAMPYNGDLLPARNILLDTPALDGSVIVVSAMLSYWDGNLRIWKEGFQPAEILRVFL